MAVGSQIGKLSAPEGRPGRGLVPGVGEACVREKQEMKGFRQRQGGRGGKARELETGQNERTTCLSVTNPSGNKRCLDREKPCGPPRKVGAAKESSANAKIRVQGSCGRRQLHVDPDDNGISPCATKVQERGKEQDRSPTSDTGLNDEPESQSSHEFMTDM